MKNENSPIFSKKIGDKNFVISLGVDKCFYILCENELCLNACSPECLLVDSWPFGLAFNKIQDIFACPIEHLILASFFQKDSVLPKRTPAVALIKAFILQLEQAFSEMQLEQAYQRPTLLYKCFSSPLYRQTPSQVPRHTGCQNGRDMNFSRLTSFFFFFWCIFHLEKFSKSTQNKQIIGCYG